MTDEKNNPTMQRKQTTMIFLKTRVLAAFLLAIGALANPVLAQNGPITVNFTVDPPSCFGYTDGSVTALPGGGVAPYSFNWENGQTGATNLGLGAGQYAVTVTDANQNTAVQSATLTQPAAISAAVNIAGDFCNTTNGTLSATAQGGSNAGFTYSWTNGLVGQSIPVTVPGLYSMTATDSESCGGVAIAVVPAPLQVSVIVENIPCFMACDGVAKAAVTGGTLPYTYAWSTGATTQIISLLPPGTYTVTVTDATGCTAVGSQLVYEPPAISIAFSDTIPACGANNGSVTAEASGGTPPFTYLWDNGQTGPTLQNAGAGTYFVQVTDNNGCQKSTSIVIPAGQGLNVSLVTTKAECPGVNTGTATAVVTPGNGMYSYQWSPASPNTPQLTGLAAGATISVTVTDVGTGCAGTATAVIGTHNQVVLNVSDIDVLCVGDQTGSATAIASLGTAPYTYTWTYPNGSQVNGQTITGLGVGAYLVTVVDTRGCTAASGADISATNNINAAFSLSVLECVGDSILIRLNDISSGGDISAWNWTVNWGSGTATFNNQAPIIRLPENETGNIQLAVQSAQGCTDTAAAPFALSSLPQVNLSVSSPAFDCANGPIPVTVMGDAGYTYQWIPTTGLTFNPGPMNVIADPAVTTLYTLVAGNGTCIDTVQLQIIRETVLTIDAGPDELVVCEEQATLTANVSAPGAIITWYNASGAAIATGPTITVPAMPVPAIYIARAINSLGCTAFDTVSVRSKENSIAIDVPSEFVDCNNGPVTVNITGAPNNNYTWVPATNLIFVDSNTVIIAPFQTTQYYLIADNGFCKDTASLKVIRVEPINLTVADTSIISCDPDQVLSAQLNAASNAQIVWTDAGGQVMSGTSPVVVAGPVPSFYTVTATDPYGCTDSETVSVVGRSVDVELSDSSSVLSTCTNQTVSVEFTNLDPLDVLSYQWMGNSPNVLITPQTANSSSVKLSATQPGSYTATVLVRNQYDCLETYVFSLQVGESIDLNGQIDIDACKGLEVTFTNNSGASGVWTFGDGNNSTAGSTTHTYAAPGQYVVSFVAADSCIIPFIDTINVLNGPAVEAAFTADITDCAASATVLFTENSNAPSGTVAWSWSFSGGTPASGSTKTVTVNYSTSGIYPVFLAVTDANGCTDTISGEVAIDLINDDIISDQSFCADDTVALNPDFNPNYTYNWTAEPADPTLASSSPNPQVSPDVTTKYCVTITNGNCQLTKCVILTPLPGADINLPDDRNLCSLDPVSVTAQTNATQVIWSTSPTFVPVVAQGVTVTLTPAPGAVFYAKAIVGNCEAVDSIRLNYVGLDINPGNLSPRICAGESASLQILNLDPTDVLTATWTPNVSTGLTAVVSPTQTTTYQVLVSNQFGCTATIPYTVTVGAIDVSATVVGSAQINFNQSAFLQGTVNSSSNYTFNWTPDNTLVGANTLTPEAKPLETTTYVLTAVNAEGCIDTAQVTIIFLGQECVEPYIFVPNTFTPNGDDANDFFLVRGVNMTELHMIVWDRWGEIVFETKDLNTQGWDGTLNGRALTPDAYAWYVSVRCGNGAFYTKKGNVTLLK